MIRGAQSCRVLLLGVLGAAGQLDPAGDPRLNPYNPDILDPAKWAGCALAHSSARWEKIISSSTTFSDVPANATENNPEDYVKTESSSADSAPPDSRSRKISSRISANSSRISTAAPANQASYFVTLQHANGTEGAPRVGSSNYKISETSRANAVSQNKNKFSKTISPSA